MTELKGQLQNVEKASRKQKKNEGKHLHFTSVAPDEIERRLLAGGPYISGQGWGSSAPGGTLNVQISITNSAPVNVGSLYVQVWVGGSGIVDHTVAGPIAWNIDTRFPRLMQPGFSGAGLNAGAKKDFFFALEVPVTVQRTNYLLCACLLRGVATDWRVLDHSIVVFEVA